MTRLAPPTACLALGLVAACASSPPPRPDLPLPQLPPAYEAGPTGTDPWAGRWWASFGNPSLDQLVEEALANNHDLQAAAADATMKSCRLKLGLEHYTAEDELEIRVNGNLLSSGDSRANFGGWSRQEWTRFPARLAEVCYEGGTLEYDLTGAPLRRGENEIEVRLIMRTVMQPTDLVLRDLEVRIEYN